jgi:hypothetical protein
MDVASWLKRCLQAWDFAHLATGAASRYFMTEAPFRVGGSHFNDFAGGLDPAQSL